MHLLYIIYIANNFGFMFSELRGYFIQSFIMIKLESKLNFIKFYRIFSTVEQLLIELYMRSLKKCIIYFIHNI